MGTKEETERSYLQGQQRLQQAELAQAQADQAAIQEKLARLEKAKKEVSTIQENIGTLKSTVFKQKEQEAWKGNCKSNFETALTDFDDQYKIYYDGVDSLYDAICDEITRLENEANDTGGIIGWLQNSLNSLGNELEKLLHF